jgi:4-amino-4-deoxy-L-arabinose transferase-like glycosyltransferase
MLAALIWLTFAGNIEKGRLIEIEALYASLTALAFIFWCSAYRDGKMGLRLWFIPAILLGLAMLAKGPLPHLLFFYGPVLALLWHDRKIGLLGSRAHLVALAAWALPVYLVSDSDRVAAVWSRQFSGRVTPEFRVFLLDYCAPS